MYTDSNKCSKKKIMVWLLLVRGLCCISCGSTYSTEPAGLSPKFVDSTDAVIRVTAIRVNNRIFEYLINSNGKVKSLYEHTFTSDNSGLLIKSKAQNGRFFKAGSLLAQLDTVYIKQKIERAQLLRFNGQKEYESQMLGYESLIQGQSPEQAEEIKQKLRISTGLSEAEQSIREANYELSKAIIKAPFSGVISDVNVHEGEQLRAGMDLFKLYDPTKLLLEIKILESDILLIKAMTPADIIAISNQEVKYQGFVYEINPYVDVNGLISVSLKISKLDTSNHALFPGMNCSAIIRVPTQRALVVPKDALVIRNGKAVVFTILNGKAKWNYVTIGRDNGLELEIKAGLKCGDLVITSNNLQLSQDAPVKELVVDQGNLDPSK